jgi:uncharacterized protein involved in cysteine biosynthesis
MLYNKLTACRSIPISFVGAWSNVEYLANTYKWLNWLNKLPETVISLLAGLVPAALLSALSSFVPKIFRGDMSLSL